MRGKYLKYFVIILLISIIVNMGFAISIGAAPGYYNFGETDRGKRYAGNIYLMTTSKNDIYVSLSYRPPQASFMTTARTGYNLSNASEEDITKWFTFPLSSILLRPSEKTLITLSNGEILYANRKATFYLNVPRNAEPGYHMGTIDLTPHLPAGGSTPSVGTIGVTRVITVFRVPGPAIRSGDIVAMEAERTGKNQARIDLLFKNTGTVTESVYPKEVKLFDNLGNVIAVLNGGAVKVKPKETKVVSVYWSSKNLKSGNYQVKATASWITGEITKIGDVTVPKEIVKKNVIEQPPGKFPWWLIVLIVLVIMLFIYWRW